MVDQLVQNTGQHCYNSLLEWCSLPLSDLCVTPYAVFFFMLVTSADTKDAHYPIIILYQMSICSELFAFVL